MTPAKYIACKYVDKTVWLGNVRDVYEFEAEVKFLHPRFPAAAYYWPQQDDFCIIPVCDIICIIDTPSISRRYGRLLDNHCKNRKFINVTTDKLSSILD